MSKNNNIGILCSLIRPEEKMLFQAFRERGAEFEKIDDRKLILDLHNGASQPAVILERCINHSRALHALKYYEDHGVRTLNSYETANICGDKLLTTLALDQAGVPTPRCLIAYTPESALDAIEQLGYPVVLKPVVGSWGRLLAKINDRDAAEAVLEHKKILGSYHHSIYYIQEYIETGGCDIRAFVLGGECFAAIYRHSEHWITNTARGASVTKCELSDELKELCSLAAKAVGGDIVAVDLFDTKDGPDRDLSPNQQGSLLVNEVNYTMEFKNSIDITGINIPQKIVDYVIETAENA